MADNTAPTVNIATAPVQVPVKTPDALNQMSWGPVPVMTSAATFAEIGNSGLKAFAGYVREEFLPQLVGRQAARVYREMQDNSPVVGGILFAVRAAMRKVEWRSVPPDDSGAAQEMADFADSLRNDMVETWEDHVDETLSMLTYGYSPNEIVYKRRTGRSPGADPQRPGQNLPKSKFDDGKIGWRRLPVRGQDTVLKWFFDQNGAVKGVTQQPWTGPVVDIPIEKLLLFRTSVFKGNPEGRALAPDTAVPTPDGWRTMDDLSVGSKIFDETGAIRYVTARADWSDRPCYRLTFSDGFEIVADANHQWCVVNQYERNNRREPTLRTTAEIAASVRTAGDVANFSIAWAGALDYPEQALLFDPYLLGMWLGDGNSNSAMITCHADDLEETLALVSGCGFKTEVKHNGKAGGNGRIFRFYGTDKWASDGPTHILRAIGVLNNKHIPAAYLRGSATQRMALLSGLMDSDGHVDNSGRCEFCNTNYSLAAGVAELVRSLGIGAAFSSKMNSHGNQAWLVKFTPTWVPFRLSRKAARCRTERQRMNHYIVSAESVEPLRTVCIEVDSPSHMFLAGEGMVPTHNSILRSAYRDYWFVKRLEEQEAILFERLNGIPVIKVPAQLLADAAAGVPEAVAALEAYKRIAVNVRVDEQMGIVLPSSVYEGANGPSSIPQYSFELVTPAQGRMTVNGNETIGRHQTNMMVSMLADFIQLGHSARGTQGVSTNKTDMFYQAIEGFLNANAAVYNRHALPRVWDLNGLDFDLMPEFQPDMAVRLDLDVLSNFILRLSQSGMPLFPNDELQSYLLDAAGIPDVTDPMALEAAGLTPQLIEQQSELALNPPPPPTGLNGPPKPADPNDPRAKLEKIIRLSIARRMQRMAGPRFGITSKRHSHRAS